MTHEPIESKTLFLCVFVAKRKEVRDASLALDLAGCDVARCGSVAPAAVDDPHPRSAIDGFHHSVPADRNVGGAIDVKDRIGDQSVFEHADAIERKPNSLDAKAIGERAVGFAKIEAQEARKRVESMIAEVRQANPRQMKGVGDGVWRARAADPTEFASEERRVELRVVGQEGCRTGLAKKCEKARKYLGAGGRVGKGGV